jgi:cation diffusion facilitator family transporter
MAPVDRTAANRRIQVITHWSLAVNIGLCLLKILVGSWVASMALLADGIHSLSDTVTDVAVLLGHRLGSRAPDRKHPYGHGRWETFSAGFIGLVLILVGGGMIYAAARAIAENRVVEPRFVILAVSLVSVLAKETLYRLTRRVAKATHSSALYANAWHQRSDALSSVAVIIGFAALAMGFAYGDHLAALVVGLMVLLVGGRVLVQCWDELTESAVDHDTVVLIERTIEANPAIHDWHKLRTRSLGREICTRSLGREIFLDLHILVDAELNVVQAHNITEGLEAAIAQQLTCPVNITIHVEPDLPEQRV